MSAWLDRLSNNTTPNSSPPPQPPRRSLHLAPGQLPSRPSLNARSTSLSLVSNASLPAAARLPAGSTLRNQISNNTPPNVQDPLEALAEVLGISDGGAWPNRTDVANNGLPEKPLELSELVDFGNLSLAGFLDQHSASLDRSPDAQTYSEPYVEEYEKERDKFEDLHDSISSCDTVLLSVEKYLTSFQADLAAVSVEIETLQIRSTTLNSKLENRKTVEKLLGPVVEQVTISPNIVRTISERPIDEDWVKALGTLQARSRAVETGQMPQDVRALDDLTPILHDLSDKAVERVRDYFATQIKGLRAPNINAQVIQQQSFLSVKSVYSFLSTRQPQLGTEIAQAYTNTMRWYYSSHFTRYHSALSKLKLHVTDRQGLLGENVVSGSRNRSAGGLSYDPFSLGRRVDTLYSSSNMALPLHAAEESRISHHIETPFVAYNLALVDNASSEYSLMTEFFTPNLSPQLTSRHFQTIFKPEFTLGIQLTKSLITETFDALGVLLLVRLTQHLAFTLQRRKVPALDTYINGTHMLLWPRFQLIVDAHCDSLRRLTASLPIRPAGGGGAAAASALLGVGGNGAANNTGLTTAPHPVTQRFAVFVHGIFTLSSEAGDDEPVSASLARLRTEFEAFLTKLGGAFGPGEKGKRDKGRLLANNYSLVLTVLGDVQGRLADETREHFEAAREVALG